MNILFGKFGFKLMSCFGALALMIVAPSASRASVVFSNLGAGSSSNIDGNEVGNDRDGDNLAEGDTFTPGGNFTMTTLQLALSCWGTCANTYTVELTNDASGVPGTSILFSSVQLGTALAAPSTTSLVTIATSAVSLVSGTSYWIVVLPDVGGTDEIQWNWNTTGDPSNLATAFAGGGAGDTWFTLGGTPSAYEVDGTIVGTGTPEPGTLGLMLGGGLLIGLLRKVGR
jgi:hypothetical protein